MVINTKVFYFQRLCCALFVFSLAACDDTVTQSVSSDVVEPIKNETENQSETRLAQASINAFATALKAELTAAMQQGGPLNAIQVCNTSAPVIADKVSVDQGVALSRVSLRNRNPDNAPLSWQRPVLESFEHRKESGESPASLDWSETVTVNGQQEFRYMKAIPAAGLCLQCHGEHIAPQVSDAINALYPEDNAIGYEEGDIRGAFVVISK